MSEKSSYQKVMDSIPDDVLIQIAKDDWDSLELLCIGLSIDHQLLKEESELNKIN